MRADVVQERLPGRHPSAIAAPARQKGSTSRRSSCRAPRGSRWGSSHLPAAHFKGGRIAGRCGAGARSGTRPPSDRGARGMRLRLSIDDQHHGVPRFRRRPGLRPRRRRAESSCLPPRMLSFRANCARSAFSISNPGGGAMTHKKVSLGSADLSRSDPGDIPSIA